MHKANFIIKNGISREDEELNSSREEDDDEKSDDSDKQIVVVNRKIKSKIFLDSNRGRKSDMSNERSVNQTNSTTSKKKDTHICDNSLLVQIIKRNNFKTGGGGTLLKKAYNTSSQFKETEKYIRRGDSKIIFKYEKFINKSEQKCTSLVDQNERSKKNSENIDKVDNTYEKNEKRECVDHKFFKEIVKSTCVNNAQVINDIESINANEEDNNQIIESSVECNNNKTRMSKMEKSIHFNQVHQDDNSRHFPHYNKMQIPLKKQSKHYTQHKEEEKNDWISQGTNEMEYHAGENLLNETSLSSHIRMDDEKEKKKKKISIEQNEDMNSHIIKYDEFELYELEKELEKITDEENNIQEKLIYLSNQELDIIIKMKQLKAANHFVQKEQGQKEECNGDAQLGSNDTTPNSDKR
ncbi:hypothetical protein, conserved [Plasmodium gonderi]|uniref:Uncharacterized protein n=1 Tax=Plasmodium gonderi TaxID=77519 RepID=A0A1Y1JEJ5_PLAGO|nr:hypothetical protein, conserved [Plasmodium gonderi]GAW80916.1 hypothetical protein, conserved [Plasmodium gonderi]